MTPNKTVVFGLDGACASLIGEWLDAGQLPTLQGLRERGSMTGLHSSVPATTPPAWSSLTTGVNPGKHGVFGFYRRYPDSYETHPVSDDDVRARRLWDYTTDHNLTSLIVNVPVTHPGRELDGALVPGYLAPDDPEPYPADLLSSVGMDDYRVYAPGESTAVSEPELLSQWRTLTESRRDLALSLMDEYDWDLLFLEFQKTDGAVHKFDDRANVRRIFETVDDCLADVLAAVEGDPNVFVVSDHGIGQPKEWSIALNTWFVEQGYATTRVGQERASDWRPDATDGSPGTAERFLGALSTIGLTKQQLERLLAGVGLYDLATRLVPADLSESVAEEVIDEPHSRAFYQGLGFSGVDTGVTINAAQYYEEGVVTSEDYESLRGELIERLEALTGPDGQRAFTSVRRREAVYEGPYVAEAPDLVCRQADDYVIGSTNPRGKPFIPAEDGRIDHTDTGLLIAAGPDIEAGWSLPETPSILDVTPTLLALLSVPLDEYFDGDPLPELTGEGDPTWQTYDRPETGQSADLSASEREALEDRLKGMGYLE